MSNTEVTAPQATSASPQPASSQPPGAPTETQTQPPTNPDTNPQPLQIPTTRKTWRATGRGAPAQVLKLVDAPVPAKLGRGEVLVRVQAAALNPVGHKMMGLLPGFVLRRASAAEYDLAGVVVDGNGTALKAGDEVFGWIPFNQALSTGQGALTQYTRVPAANLVLRPKNVTPTEAAGFALAGLTAWQALLDVGRLEAGQSVFVNGGSTAVGAFAIQIAKAKGSRVAASASGKNEQYVRDLGADEFFDYTKAPLHEQLVAAQPTPKYHIFFEAVGLADKELFTRSAAYLAPNGVFISVGPQGSVGKMASYVWNVFLRPGFLGGTKRTWKLAAVKPVHKDLEEFAKLVEEGKIRPLVDSVFAFEDALKAYERIMTKRATGKVVVKVDPTAA
ncbi:NAD-P-binding protein [Trametes cingulata]|nr:NAD-P-binding protein [Trametes cingulata]